MCIHDKRARFLLRRPQTRCGCWRHRGGGSGYSGVDGAHLAGHRELSFHLSYSFVDDGHFLIIFPVDFQFLMDLIRCCLVFGCKRIVIILSYSSNMAADGIGGEASGAIARRRQATLLV